ncbi:protein takeout-like [Anastrepha obliqua]|uniref:protein takeout-like n=1 Tax=Anastrepha obliqua TaxID=95512 RepID=UPI00240A81C4|nr:protein takeout-like [Anastrepha obliqua]
MKMFKLYKIFLALMPFLVLQVIANFPDNPKPCKFGDKTCIMNTIEYLMHEKSQGFASLNLVKTEPLRVAKIVMKQGGESPVNIDLTFTNNDVTGFSEIKMNNVKGFGKELTTKHDLYVTAPVLSLIGDYSIKGRVLVLPITGTGTSNITMVNVKIHIQFTGAPMQKSDGIYMNVKDVRLRVDPSRMIFNFDNLFNGDKVLGDTMNNFLNENWKDIYEEVRATFANAFAQIFSALIHKVFSKYPYEKYFLE